MKKVLNIKVQQGKASLSILGSIISFGKKKKIVKNKPLNSIMTSFDFYFWRHQFNVLGSRVNTFFFIDILDYRSKSFSNLCIGRIRSRALVFTFDVS